MHCLGWFHITPRIHVWYISLLIYNTNQPTLGKYTSPVDPMGNDHRRKPFRKKNVQKSFSKRLHYSLLKPKSGSHKLIRVGKFCYKTHPDPVDGNQKSGEENHWLDGAKTLVKKIYWDKLFIYIYISTGAGFFPINSMSPLPGWWFHCLLIFTPIWGKWSNFTNIFQRELKPPTSLSFPLILLPTGHHFELPQLLNQAGRWISSGTRRLLTSLPCVFRLGSYDFRWFQAV